jgi:hypothetical protein
VRQAAGQADTCRCSSTLRRAWAQDRPSVTVPAGGEGRLDGRNPCGSVPPIEGTRKARARAPANASVRAPDTHCPRSSRARPIDVMATPSADASKPSSDDIRLHRRASLMHPWPIFGMQENCYRSVFNCSYGSVGAPYPR